MNQPENSTQSIVSEDVSNEAQETARLTDLTLTETQSNEIKGGLLPAVQKVRDAAARVQVGSSGLSAGKVSYSDLH